MGLRVDSAMYPQYQLPPFYDSMIGKIIVHQPTRQLAFQLLKRALVEVVVDGVTTNVDLLNALVQDESVQQDTYHTKWLEETFMPQWLESRHSEE